MDPEPTPTPGPPPLPDVRALLAADSEVSSVRSEHEALVERLRRGRERLVEIDEETLRLREEARRLAAAVVDGERPALSMSASISAKLATLAAEGEALRLALAHEAEAALPVVAARFSAASQAAGFRIGREIEAGPLAQARRDIEAADRAKLEAFKRAQAFEERLHAAVRLGGDLPAADEVRGSVAAIRSAVLTPEVGSYVAFAAQVLACLDEIEKSAGRDVEPIRLVLRPKIGVVEFASSRLASGDPRLREVVAACEATRRAHEERIRHADRGKPRAPALEPVDRRSAQR